MATGFTPLPGQGAAPQGIQSAEMLLGQPGRPEARGPQADATQSEASKAFMAQIRRLHALIDDTARMAPEFSDIARQMKQLAQEGMVRVVAQQRGRKEPTPNLPG